MIYLIITENKIKYEKSKMLDHHIVLVIIF